MANVPLKSITFPGLADTYTIPQVDSTLAVIGAAADAKKTGDEITDLKEALETKAEIDGSYDDLTAGNAKQLESTQYVGDSEPYLFRTSGGSADIGNREYVDAIVGGSAVWNQMINKSSISSSESKGITYTSNGDGSLTVSGTATGGISSKDVLNVTLDTSHVYLFWRGVTGGAWDHWAVYDYNNNGAFGGNQSSIGIVGKPINTIGRVRIQVWEGESVNFVTRLLYFDLTKMFGSTVADYIYSLEQANAGAGAAWFKKLFPKPYYAYDAGTLKSVEGVSSHVMTGFNQWDEEWRNGYYKPSTGDFVSNSNYFASKNPIKVFPSTVYYIGSHTNATWEVFYYDSSMNFISYEQKANTTFATPSNCAYINFNGATAVYGTTYNHDICINLSWSGTHNGEYQPYEKYSYPLDDSLILRGIPKLDAQNNLYYDGDTYEADGTVTRRYGVVDLGTLNWSRTESNESGIYYFTTASNAIPAKFNTGGVVQNILASGYVAVMANTIVFGTAPNKAIGMTDGKQVRIRDDFYTDATTFKAAMSGVYLVYELATPTTETADPYQEVQICNDWGTEEYVSTSIVPVGHETRYPANLRDKLQHLPDLADADGYYAIKQVGTQMSLEPFRIPKAPETDGTYILKATVASGTPTYTWVDESQEVTEG